MISELFEKYQKPFLTDNRHPFFLNQPHAGWFIKKGAVDIFMVRYQNKKIIEPRIYMCRVMANQLVLSFGDHHDNADIQFIAVGVPNTEVIPVLPSQWSEYCKEEMAAKEIRELIKNWLVNFYESTWIKHNSELQNELKKIIENFPEINFFELLEGIHKKVIAYFLETHHIQKSTERDRLQTQRKSERRNFLLALYQLATIVSIQNEDTVMSETHHALLDACQLVAQTLGSALSIDVHTVNEQEPHFLENLLKRSQLVMRQVTLSDRWWQQDCGALLAFKDNRPVALLPTHEEEYALIDPEKSTRTKVTADIAKTISPQAYMFFRTFPAKTITLKNLIQFSFSKQNARDFIRLLIMGVMGGILAVVVPYATGVLFDKIIPSNEYYQLLQIILILIVVSCCIGCFEFVRSIALLRIEGRINMTAQPAMIDRLLNLPAPFFRKYTSGDLTQRVLATDSILQLLTGSTQTAILSGIFSIFAGIYMFFLSVPLACVAVGLVFVTVVIFVLLNIWRLTYERQFSQLQGSVLNRVFQLLHGIVKLRVAGAELRSFIVWTKEFGEQVKMTVKAQNIQNYLTVISTIFLVVASLVLYGFIAVRGLAIHTGTFLAFYAAFIQFAMAIMGMSMALTESINAIPLYERAKPILQTLPEVDEKKVSPEKIIGAIEVSHVSFRYSVDAPLVIEDVSLSIKPGQFIAIVGPSSSGKSTLFRLLVGLEKAESGAIYYDGQDMNELNLQELRRQLGVVIQNAKLLMGDIFMNIVGSSSATLDDAWEAARLAGFEDDIKAMPMGMKTIIGEDASTISGGQRQRLLIARAIVNKPKIILFDEASSALDNVTQGIVTQSLQQLNATRIVIAHRLSTIMNADMIYVMDEGRIVERGTYEELMQLNGQFASLAKRQLLSVTESA